MDTSPTLHLPQWRIQDFEKGEILGEGWRGADFLGEGRERSGYGGVVSVAQRLHTATGRVGSGWGRWSSLPALEVRGYYSRKMFLICECPYVRSWLLKRHIFLQGRCIKKRSNFDTNIIQERFAGPAPRGEGQRLRIRSGAVVVLFAFNVSVSST